MKERWFDDEDLDDETAYWLALAEGVDDDIELGTVKEARRTWDGTFGQVPSRIFPADGREKGNYDRQVELAKTVIVLIQVVLTRPLFEALESMAALRHTVELLERELVCYARSNRWSWADVSRALQISRSAAHERFAQVDVPFRRRGA